MLFLERHTTKYCVDKFCLFVSYDYGATLCASFSSKLEAINVFPKHILKSKARDQSIQESKKLLSRDNKELFVQRFVKVFDQN